MAFREYVFVRALIDRPESVRQMERIFQPDWLDTPELRPILREIYEFSKTKSTPPNISTLREIFKKNDDILYRNRFERVLDDLEKTKYETPDAVYEIDNARNVAICRSFRNVATSHGTSELLDDYDGAEVIQTIESWLRLFSESSDSTECTLETAVKSLILERGWDRDEQIKIPTGIPPLDIWSGGGLRRKEIGILLAPSGHGKTLGLIQAAFNIVKQQEQRVLFISNELDMNAITERFLTKFSGESLEVIGEDPIVVWEKMGRHFESKINENLMLISTNIETSTDWIQEKINKYINLYGWKPDVILIDYMGRMKPTVSNLNRDKTWTWMKYVARDIMRLAKSNNCLVWTAAQTNREGIKSKKGLGMEMGADSIGHFQEADLVIGMKQVDTVKGLGLDSESVLMQFTPAKIRHAKNPHKVAYYEAKPGRINVAVREIDRLKVKHAMGDDVDDQEKELFKS